MILSNINNKEDVTDDLVASLAGLSVNLSVQSDDVIQLYANNSIMSPDAHRVLESQDVLQVLANEPNQGVASDSVDFVSEDDESFGLLSFPENDSIFGGLWSRVKDLFTGLKKKVRRIFCQVVSALGSSQDFDLKQIIKDVLLVLIPALAASSGLMPVALPIVVSLAAMLLKYGVNKVCPV